MINAGDGGFMQGRAINRPPLFNGENFAHWKVLMKMFILDQDIGYWKLIQQGLPVVYHEGGERKGEIKTEEEYSTDEMEVVSRNCKLMYMLYCSLSADEFNRVSTCKTAKEI